MALPPLLAWVAPELGLPRPSWGGMTVLALFQDWVVAEDVAPEGEARGWAGAEGVAEGPWAKEEEG